MTKRKGRPAAIGRTKRKRKASKSLPMPRGIDLTEESIRRGESFGIVGATAQANALRARKRAR